MSYTAYGVMLSAPPPRWPANGPLQQPLSRRWYTYVADAETVLNTDPVVSVSADIAPSGAGEAAIGGLTVSGDAISALLIGGVPGRFYIVRLVITLRSAQVFEVLISFPIDSMLAAYPLPAPASEGFGVAATWTASGLSVGIYGVSTYGGSIYG